MKANLLTVVIILLFQISFAQTIVCEGSPCTSNDFTIDTFYLGDENGVPFGPGYCEPGTIVDAHLWINFTANTAANRYDLYLHFNLYVDGVFINTIDECYYDDQPIPTDVSLDTLAFSWECGAEISLQNVYMGWQTNNNGTCHCSQSHCYSEPIITVEAPLIANFGFDPNCDTAFTIDFYSTTSGGIPPYTFLWDFGDGNTSTLENPTHTYASTGPYNISLTVQDQENTDSYSVEILEFDSNIPPSINAPPALNLIGCDTSVIIPLIYNETETQILESEFISLGGNFVIGSDLVSLTYSDSSSGSCPLVITRTFTIIDSCNNIATDIQSIAIQDDVLPTASNPATITVACIVEVPIPDVNVITDEADNCSTPIVVFVSDVSNVQSCPETITRTYSVTDACNNSITVTQSIIIQDDILPTASNPITITVACIGDVSIPDVNVVIDEADNCSTPTVTFVSDVSDNLTCPETITRTYSITDACNNSIIVTQYIIIQDDILPTASNPTTITVACINDVPVSNVNVITDEADNCSIPIVAFVSDVSDNLTCPETITRTYSVTDACNNSITVTQSIIIHDDIFPTASNPVNILVACIGNVPIPNVNVVTDETDNCAIPTVTFVSDVSDNLTCPETITRTYSVTDACSNSVTVTQVIIIQDDILPTASNPASITVTCIGDLPTPNVDVVTDETDNCSTPTVAFVSDVSNNLTCPETVTRTYSVTDACNNSITVIQSIIIQDNILPTASNPASITVACIGDVPIPNIDVVTDEADNCSTPTVAFVSDVSNVQNCPETITRTYSVTDACNNSITVTQIIIIQDDILPTASNPANVLVACISDVPTPNTSVVTDEADNCKSPIVTFVSDVSDNMTCPETITRTYSVTDACNNTIIVTQSITILDDVLPTASNPSDLFLSCADAIPSPNINDVIDESDNCSVPTVSFVSDISNGSCPEVILRTYRVSDLCNNFILVQQSLIFDDTDPPIVVTPYDEVLTVSCLSIPDAPILEFIDNCSNDLIVTFTETSTNDNNTIDYVITREWTVTDACGNQNIYNQTINIIIDDCVVVTCNSCGVSDDVIPPTATNPPDLILSCTLAIPSPDTNVVTDEWDNCITPIVTFVSETISIDCFEKVIRIYRVTDECGNFIEVTHTINIVDNVFPTASNPVDINVDCIDNVPSPDVNVVTDEADNCSTPTVTFVSDIATNSCLGQITRTYRVTDDCGNSIDVVQLINVEDDVVPTASNPAPIMVVCIGDVPTPNINEVTDEADNCSIPTVAFVSDVSDNLTCPETIIRTYSVTDTCNNSITVTQSIIIQDDILPTASNPLTFTVSCISDVPSPNINVVTDEADNCSIPTVVFVSDVSDNQTCPVTITRTFSVTDTCNNSITVTQSIIIQDDIIPTASNPTSITIACIGDLPSPDINEVTDEADNCLTPSVAFISDVSDNQTCPETITRTYSITDACNNSISVTQSIIIQDDVLPTASNPTSITVTCIGDLPSPDINVVTDEADNCSTPTVVFISDISNNQTCPEIITRTYSIADACNNSITVTQSIIIQDDILPTASNPVTITVACISDVPVPNIDLVTDEADNCSIPTVAFISEVTDNQVCPETITRTYSVTDACNNSITVTQSVIIHDDVLPAASNPVSISVSCISDIPTPNVNVVTDEADNCSTPTVAFISDVTDNLSCPETITRTYSVTDACNNSIIVTQSVIIQDDISPTASNPLTISVSCFNDVPAPNIDVVTDEADNCSTPTVSFVSDVSDNQTCPITITRTYSVTDICNNSITVTQSIIVQDDVLPTASNPVAIKITCVDDVPAPNVDVVTDEADNCSTPTVAFISDVSDNQTCPETITRTYSVTDTCNNSISVTQNIIIQDDIAPTLASTYESLIYITCEEVPDIPVLEFEDNCSNNISIDFNETINQFDDSNYSLIRDWIVNDECNNQSNFTQIIYVSSNSESETKQTSICIQDQLMDLNTFITNTDVLSNDWESDDMDLIDGYLLDPSQLQLGSYQFQYTYTEFGCARQTILDVIVDDDCVFYPCIESVNDVKITKMVTANNDGNHDFLVVDYILNENSNEVCNISIHIEIFNRWGVKVYENRNYHNQWNGDSPNNSFGQSNKLPTGTYFYIVRLNNSGLKPIQNYILLGTD